MAAGWLDGKTALVTGAGRSIGRGIACTLAQQGADLLICDVAEDLLREAAEIAQMGCRCERLVVDLSREEDASGLVGWAIERFDHLDILVNNNLQGLVPIVRDDVIVATNTSGISVTDIGQSCGQPARVVGMHFFNPPPLLRLAEVVRGYETSEKAMATARAVAEQCGKTVR